MTKETLEDAARNYSKGLVEPMVEVIHYVAFKDGAKWQQEISYSEEEVKRIIFKFTNDFDMKKNIEVTLKEQNKWFEQFKK
jgi:uncharacterized protein YwgA